ncbi:hypothetical protein Scep_002156 [Stephania cephalantha]|uniref:Uncharacterized protein n=1 Tax=Stephania cephalantha TaxID=152367 RepID=A0AAP0LC49_9MAGN
MQYLEKSQFDNRLSCKIPKNIGRLGKLEIFRVGGNQNLNGELPWEIGNCSNLVVLGVARLVSLWEHTAFEKLVEEPSNNCNVHIFVVGSNTVRDCKSYRIAEPVSYRIQYRVRYRSELESQEASSLLIWREQLGGHNPR